MARVLRIYLDACALNRLTDDPAQQRIAREAEAVYQLLRRIRLGQIAWVASSSLAAELGNNPNEQIRKDALALLRYACEIRRPSSSVIRRGRNLHLLGYGIFDALHLPIAEERQYDVLLTTDDRFLRQARRRLGGPTVRVDNPLNYVKEMAP